MKIYLLYDLKRLVVHDDPTISIRDPGNQDSLLDRNHAKNSIEYIFQWSDFKLQEKLACISYLHTYKIFLIYNAVEQQLKI